MASTTGKTIATAAVTTRNSHNVCAKVRQSCQRWIKESPYNMVSIIKSEIPALASRIAEQAAIQWDEDQWHYQPPKNLAWPDELRRERMALYILALDSINFCFWPSPYMYEYQDLATTLTKIASQDHDAQSNDTSRLSSDFALSPENMRNITSDDMVSLFQKHHTLSASPPDIQKRSELWRQVGSVLLDQFEGSALKLIERADGSAVNLVQLLIDHFEGFRDYATIPMATSKNKLVENTSDDSDPLFCDCICPGKLEDVDDRDVMYFLKRAQICVGDWNASLELNLNDMDQLTTFADYRVPQLLRYYKVLTYIPVLAQKVDDKIELEPNSYEEISIRAATVHAVEKIVHELQRQFPDRTWTAVQTDWYLWQVGEKLDRQGTLQPFHRVRTIYY